MSFQVNTTPPHSWLVSKAEGGIMTTALERRDSHQKTKNGVNKRDVEILTNMLFLRKNCDKKSPLQRQRKKAPKQVLDFCESNLLGTIEEVSSTSSVSWRIIGMRPKRIDGVSTDYDVYRITSTSQIGGRKIRERLPNEKREAVLRLCRYDSDIDIKVFKHEYFMFRMLAKSYTHRSHCLHFPAVLDHGFLSELRYLNFGEGSNRHRDILEVPRAPRPYFILEAIEPSVETLFKSNRNKHLPVHTSIFVTIGCIKALRLLHMKGFAHRNVQPAYFSLRLPHGGLLIRKESELCDLIAITELWTCRKYRAHLARARTGLSYVGNWKYGSIETLSGKKPTAIDDLISCIYMMTEFVLGDVPWHTQTEKQAIINSKKEVEMWEKVEDGRHNTLLINYRKLYDWLHSQPSFRTIDYEALYEEILKVPETGNNSGVSESLFGFSNPLGSTYEHGFVEKKKWKQRKGDVSKSSEKRKEKTKACSKEKTKLTASKESTEGVKKDNTEYSTKKSYSKAKRTHKETPEENKSRVSELKGKDKASTRKESTKKGSRSQISKISKHRSAKESIKRQTSAKESIKSK